LLHLRWSIMIRTLNESFLIDWGCLVSNNNSSNSPMAKIALVYVAMSLPSHTCWKVVASPVFSTKSSWKVVTFLSHHRWTVVTHSCCTVMKLNSAEVQTEKKTNDAYNIKYYNMKLFYDKSSASYIPFRHVLYNMMMVVATRSVSLLAWSMLDRLKYFTTVLTKPVVSGLSLPFIASSSTPESFLYRNTSTQMHTIVYANNVPIDIIFISWSRFKIAVTIAVDGDLLIA